MTTILLVRHGITAENLTYTLLGRTDPALHPYGILQAQAVAAALKSVTMSAIVSSPLQRSVQTAQYIAKSQNAEVSTMAELTEIDLGIVDGLSSFVAYEKYRTLMDEALDESRPDFCFPDGEKRSSALIRFQSGVEGLVNQYPHSTVCVVTHGGPLGLWLAHLHKQKLGRFRAWQPSHGSITQVVYETDLYRVVACNQTAHLPDELQVVIQQARKQGP